MKQICVVDGKGGGIGKAIIRKLRETCGESFGISAVGTNEIATAQMLRAGADRGAFGGNAVVCAVEEADIIIGPVSIIMAHAMMGEITPGIAEAVAGSPAIKLLLPLSQENLEMIGCPREPLPHLIEALLHRIAELR